METNTEYNLLQPDVTVQIASPQNDEKKDETKDTEFSGSYCGKNPLFLSTTLYLKSINIEKQEFDVKGWIHVFWNDSYLLQQLTNNNNNNNTRKYSDLSTDIQNHLPLKPKDGYLFENSKRTSLISEPIIEYNSNGSFRMTIQMESIFDQTFIPEDAYILNLKLLYNYNKYEWHYWNKDAKWLQEYGENKIKLYNWEHSVSFAMHKCNSIQWNAVGPNLHFHKEFNFYLLSFRIERKSSSQSDICGDVIAPLFIVIGCTFGMYGFSYNEWPKRLFLIFLSFIFAAIIHVIKTIKKYEFRAFIWAYIILALLMTESMMLGLNVFEIKSSADKDTFDLVSAISLGVVWLVAVISAMKNRHNHLDPHTEKYWKIRYKKQWKKWKKSEFTHL